MEGKTLQDIVDQWEKRAILATLEQVKGSRNEAATRLGINRTTLFNKMKKFGLMEAG
jgi:DNA-binding NtrC family response regulator